MLGKFTAFPGPEIGLVNKQNLPRLKAWPQPVSGIRSLSPDLTGFGILS